MLGLVNLSSSHCLTWLRSLSVWFVIMDLLTFVSEFHWIIVCLSTLMLLLHGFISGFGNTTIGCIFPMTNHSFIQHLSQHTLQHLFDDIFLFYMRHRTAIPYLHFIFDIAKRNGFYFRTSDVHILAHINTTRSVTFMHLHCILLHAFILISIENKSSHWKWKFYAYLMAKPYRYGTQNWDKINAHLDMKTHCRLSRSVSSNWLNEWMVEMHYYFTNIISCQQVDTCQYYLFCVMEVYRILLSG